jgi:predicted dehydrogenase
MADRLRIGIVGAGPVTERYHLSAVRGVPEVRPTFIIDVDGARAKQFAGRNGFPHWSTKLSDLFDTVDLAIVALPNHLHAPVSCELLSHGVHVLCEKPMARTPKECKSMIDAASRSGALLAIGHNRRFKNHFQLAKEWLGKGLIGEITSVEAEEGSASDWQRSAAYFDHAKSGGGSLMDVGIHAIDLIRWLAGEFGEVEFSGDGTASRVEGEAEMRFRLQNGATGKVVCSRSRELAQRLTIRSPSGFIEASLWGDELRVRTNHGKAFRHFSYLNAFVSRRPPADSSFVDQLYNLVQAIRGQASVLVDGAEGMAAVDVVCRAYGSHSSPEITLATASASTP